MGVWGGNDLIIIHIKAPATIRGEKKQFTNWISLIKTFSSCKLQTLLKTFTQVPSLLEARTSTHMKTMHSWMHLVADMRATHLMLRELMQNWQMELIPSLTASKTWGTSWGASSPMSKIKPNPRFVCYMIKLQVFEFQIWRDFSPYCKRMPLWSLYHIYPT